MIAGKRGLFIAVEGIDGAGKRTLCSFIKKSLESQNYKVIQFAYPDYSSNWGKIIEDYLHNRIELNVDEQFFAYFIDILKDQDRIRKSLEDEDIVITDRYFSSTIAFQCAKGFNYQKALSIMDIMEVIKPDLTLFIKIPPHLALKRKFNQKRSLDRHEKDAQLLEDVDMVYEKMLKNEVMSGRWIQINGDQDLEKVKEDLLRALIGIVENLQQTQTL